MTVYNWRPIQYTIRRIELAAANIDPVFLNTPQTENVHLNAALGTRVILKNEALTPIGSFKGRGADWLLRSRPFETSIVTASAGNFGSAIAWAAQKHGRRAHIFASDGASEEKLNRMRDLGARLTIGGRDLDDAKARAKEFAATDGAWFVEDGAEPEVMEGAGTIAMELDAIREPLDAIIVPVGNGSLLAGIGSWMKLRAPHVRIIGVCSAGAPAMYDSWRDRAVRSTESVRTIADGIAVREPIPIAVEQMLAVADDIVVVRDDAIIEAMRLLFKLGITAEPAAAAAIAAVPLCGFSPASIVAIPLTGSNVDGHRLAEWKVI